MNVVYQQTCQRCHEDDGQRPGCHQQSDTHGVVFNLSKKSCIFVFVKTEMYDAIYINSRRRYYVLFHVANMVEQKRVPGARILVGR